MIEKETDKKEAEVYTEKSEAAPPDLSDEQIRAAALAYARYLKEHDLKPGDVTFAEPETLGVDIKEKKPEKKEVRLETAIPSETEPRKKKAAAGKRKKQAKKKAKAGKKYAKKNSAGEKTGKNPMAGFLDWHDTVQDRIDTVFSEAGKDFAKGAHRIASTYRNSGKAIGMGLLVIGMLVAVVLIIFDRFTVYEYAYNGKVLGYVNEQEEVTDILDVAGEELTRNSRGNVGVEFVANQNITFNPVDGRGKSTDDADTAVNKLIYLTDIETEAFAVCDGSSVVAIVKDNDEAEELLLRTKEELSRPDNGMRLESSEFTNELAIKPVNVLLSSVQSSAAAGKLMIEGGEMEIFHIVEEGETLESLSDTFGVAPESIYGEDGELPVEEIEQGDKVCIRSSVEPVSVEMVESGRMKEVIEYKTIKEESDEYYQGDTHVKQEGINQIQIFEGTITKRAGNVIERKKTAQPEIIKKGQDKIILVGTKERPKTAPTGTYATPTENYVVTSEFGPRWGRMHLGIDLGAPMGTPIYATDGGTVIRAEYFGGYGNCVDIQHEDGRVTRYGHSSKLLVSVGDQVYQGQEIALVGSTGNSTGPHLHFEIIINGTQQNPRQFMEF